MNRTGDQRSRLKSFSQYHLPPILYGLGVLALSSIPDLSSPGPKFTLSDKLAHLVEYSIFAFLLFRSLSHLSGRANFNGNLVRTATILTFFAIGDEVILQSFVPGRHSDLFDLAADLSGVCLILVGTRFLHWFRPGSVG